MAHEANAVDTMTARRNRQLQPDSSMTSSPFFTDFVSAFMFQSKKNYPFLEEAGVTVRLYSGAVLKTSTDQSVIMEYIGDSFLEGEPVDTTKKPTMTPSQEPTVPGQTPPSAAPAGWEFPPFESSITGFPSAFNAAPN
jgi:hypothetical protein